MEAENFRTRLPDVVETAWRTPWPRATAGAVAAVWMGFAAIFVAHRALDSHPVPVYLHIQKLKLWNGWSSMYGPGFREIPERMVALLGDSVMTRGDFQLENGAPVPDQL